jgi:hypothetical protein
VSEQQQPAFATWAVIEVMGHRSYGGFVTEQQIAGCAFVRVDVPQVVTSRGVKMQAYTKLFGAASIYCISPCTEDLARLHESRKLSGYDELRLPALPEPAMCGVVETGDPDDDAEHDPDDDEF